MLHIARRTLKQGSQQESHAPSRKRWVAAICALASLLGGMREANAYCRSTACEPSLEDCTKDDKGCPRSGPPLSWKALPLPYRFHAGGTAKLDMDKVREATRRSFDTWSNVTCNGKRTSLRFEEGSDIPGNAPLSGPNKGRTSFGIYFRDDDWPYDDGEESLALTNQTYGKTNGFIDYSSIEVNTTTREYRLSDDEQGIDFQAVLTHEVGHYIGLAHSGVDGSIMAPSYCQSSDRCNGSTDAARALSDDDIMAVCALYPPSGIAGVAFEDPSASSCALSGPAKVGSNEPVSPVLPIASLAGLAALVIARARKRSSARG
ncbi:MAG: hypothetical protein JWO86_2887 [Myxococcaceae bacterium]|nr:hypothetical protein [Myxococcaceae bacterium]